MKRAVALIALLPLPALADNDLVFRPEVIDACLAAGGGTTCVGRGADTCSDETPGGDLSMGWALCIDAEYGWWQARLDAALEARLAMAARIDAANDSDPQSDQPSDVAATANMQAAWEAWREATCRFEALQYWGGSGASAMTLECLMRLTGAQALYLEASLTQ